MQTREIGDDLVVTLRGRIDSDQGAIIEGQLNQLIKDNSDMNFIIDLGDVDFLSSAGIRVLISSNRAITENKRKFSLCNLTVGVDKLIKSAKLDSILTIYKDVNTALDDQ